MISDKEKFCSYTRLDNGIHKMIFHRASHAGVDQLIEHLKHMNSITPPGEKQLVLIDVRPDGIPPLNYTVQALRKFYKESSQPELRSAYLYYDSILISIAKTLINSLAGRKATRRFFHGDKESEAIAWLLSG